MSTTAPTLSVPSPQAHALHQLLIDAIDGGSFADASIVDRLKAAASACTNPDPAHQAVSATLLAGEMQSAIQHAWNRWDRMDQEDAPALGDELERLASTSIAGLLEARTQARDQARAIVQRDNLESDVERLHQGVVVSAWSEADMDFLFADDHLEHLSDDALGALMPQIFLRISRDLKDVLASKGNAHLESMWQKMRQEIVAELKIPARNTQPS